MSAQSDLRNGGFGYDAPPKNVAMPGYVSGNKPDGTAVGDVAPGRATQTVRTSYTVTAADIINGFIVIPISFPSAFADVRYTPLFGIYDEDAQINLSYIPGDIHTKTVNGFTAVAYIAAQPVLQQTALDALNVNTNQTLSATSPIGTLYSVAIYADSRGDGGGSAGQDMLTITLNWIDPSGYTPRNLVVSSSEVDGSILGSAAQITKSILAVAGSTISVTTTFTGSRGHTFHFDLSVRLLRTPTTTPPEATAGDVFEVQAIAVHD